MGLLAATGRTQAITADLASISPGAVEYFYSRGKGAGCSLSTMLALLDTIDYTLKIVKKDDKQ